MTDRKITRRSRSQVAALPFRVRDGVLEVMLITSRETARWIIPKGWAQSGRKAHAASAREAREEAGVIGKITKRPIGTFRYQKRLSPEQEITCKVQVFPFEVGEVRSEWPEQADRQRCWLPVAEAARLVADSGLRRLLLKLPRLLRRAGS
ncbi:MAG: NUDIX hydrolase [Defluviicoccus sp.]